MVEVLGTGVTPSAKHSMIFALFDEAWATDCVEVAAREAVGHAAFRELPQPLQSLLRTLANSGTIVRVELAMSTVKNASGTSLRLQTRAATASVSSIRRFAEVVEVLERQVGSASDADVERESNRERPRFRTSPAQQETHRLRIRWQLALKKLFT